MKPEIIKDNWSNGNLKYEWYYLNVLRHREDGPAINWYYENGNKSFEYYYINGLLHREDGPAFIEYDQNGNINIVSYYINGKELTESEWLVLSRKRKLKNL